MFAKFLFVIECCYCCQGDDSDLICFIFLYLIIDYIFEFSLTNSAEKMLQYLYRLQVLKIDASQEIVFVCENAAERFTVDIDWTFKINPPIQVLIWLKDCYKRG